LVTGWKIFSIANPFSPLFVSDFDFDSFDGGIFEDEPEEYDCSE
jgi:hypothetical protein